MKTDSFDSEAIFVSLWIDFGNSRRFDFSARSLGHLMVWLAEIPTGVVDRCNDVNLLRQGFSGLGGRQRNQPFIVTNMDNIIFVGMKLRQVVE